MNETVKVSKNGIVKQIQKKDLPQYLAKGWKVVENYFDITKKYTTKIV